MSGPTLLLSIIGAVWAAYVSYKYPPVGLYIGAICLMIAAVMSL